MEKKRTIGIIIMSLYMVIIGLVRGRSRLSFLTIGVGFLALASGILYLLVGVFLIQLKVIAKTMFDVGFIALIFYFIFMISLQLYDINLIAEASVKVANIESFLNPEISVINSKYEFFKNFLTPSAWSGLLIYMFLCLGVPFWFFTKVQLSDGDILGISRHTPEPELSKD